MSMVSPKGASNPQEEIHYPAEDGLPMAETGIHVRSIVLLFQALEDALPETSFIAADMFWYWEEGHPKSRVAPDVMVVPGVGRAERRSFFTWRENGAIPCAVIEMASEGTWREDVDEKHDLYERLGVREYFMFDPEEKYLSPPLQGYRLVGRGYKPLEHDTEGRLRSESLGLYLKAEGVMLRLLDGATGNPIPTRAERVEYERRHAERERQHAERERQHAERERQDAERERQRADALAAEIERLKQLLEQSQSGPGGDRVS
jgi:Uma2 family endonuclease